MRNVPLIAALFLMLGASAQDIHFSQFSMNPLHYSPSFVGQFDGKWRASAAQRTQWRSVTVPWVTFGGTMDWNGVGGRDGLNAGFSVAQDRAGDSRMNLIHINGVGGFDMAVGRDSSHQVSFGLVVGLTHLRIDYSALEFDNQFNGTAFDPNLANGESFTTRALTYGQFGAGIGYAFSRSRREMARLGIGFQNLNQPNQSLNDALGVDLDVRLSLHASGAVMLAEQWDVLPAVLWQAQGKFRELLVGGAARYVLVNEGPAFRSVLFGIYGRTRDAGYLMVGGEYDAWRLGISYDINTSNLRPASNGRGGLELALRYIHKPVFYPTITRRYCPEFL